MRKDDGNLKSATAKGFLWGGMSNAVCQMLNLFFGIFLANILGPDDYGPIGMLAIFSAIAGSLQESGFVAALANRKQVNHDDYNAVFWFNVISSLLLYAGLYFAAPLIADYFHEPILVPLSRYSFIGFVVAGFGIAPSAYLFRELKVKQKSIALMLSIIVSGSVGVIMAMNGYSYWGIATQGILYVLVRSICYWWWSPWRPTWCINFAPLRYLFAFSYRLLVTNLFLRINCNVFSFILGGNGYYTRADVGNYTKANEWNTMGSEIVNGMVNGVAQPVLARVADDGERQLHVLRKMLRFTAFISFPMLLGLSLVSRELIIVAITEKWSESAHMLRILCLWGAFIPIQSLFTNLLISRGRSQIYMWSTIAQGTILTLMLFALRPYGISDMIVSYVILNMLWLVVWHHFVKREIALTLPMLLRDIVPYFVLSAAVMAITYMLTRSIDDIYILLPLRIAVAAALYVAALYLFRSAEMREAVDYIKTRKTKPSEQ
ncbi:MAG: lipopolysaccharide biosynthesis protein [Bacteroidaceae bacterium]|nr:lipopolysaccharide biosynthesis protein [Bacteroidaceae bacterium]